MDAIQIFICCLVAYDFVLSDDTFMNVFVQPKNFSYWPSPTNSCTWKKKSLNSLNTMIKSAEHESLPDGKVARVENETMNQLED